MIKLDENLLVELGLAALPKDEKTSFLKHMYETLEMRVGTRLAERMSDQQMSEFEQFINSNDEQGAFQWLESNFPNYKEVVAEEFEKLKGEIKPMAADILAASQAQVQQPQHAQQLGAQPAPGSDGQETQMSQASQMSQQTPAYSQQSLPPQQPFAQSHFNEPHSTMPPQDTQQAYQQPPAAMQPQQPYTQPQVDPQQQPQYAQPANLSPGQQPQTFQQSSPNPQTPQQQYSTPPQYFADDANQQQPQQPGHHPQYPA